MNEIFINILFRGFFTQIQILIICYCKLSINMKSKPLSISLTVSALMLMSIFSGCLSSDEFEPEFSNDAPIINGEINEDIYLSEAGLISLSVEDEDINTLMIDATINDLATEIFMKNSELLGWSIVISISDLDVGNHKLKVTAIDESGQQATWISIISIVSDPIDLAENNQTEVENNEESEENTNDAISGCMDSTALNYNSEATKDDESCSYLPSQPMKILALHGGGGSAESLQSDSGIQDLMQALPGYDFYFPQTPESDGVWIMDPPGGKEEGTTDPGWANESVTYLDSYVLENGPFEAILGYSQGAAMSVIYLAYSDTIFEKVILMNGYLETGHQGLMSTIEEQSPFHESALIFEGEDDEWFGYGSTELVDIFSNSTHLIGDAGHNPPEDTDRAFQDVVGWIKEHNNPNNPEPVEYETGTSEWWSEILLCDEEGVPVVDDYNTSEEDNHQCDVSFSIESGNITFSTNGLPNHDLESGPGCCASTQTTSYTIPLEPTNDTDCEPSITTTGCTMAPVRGSIAFAVNGVAIYGPEDGPGGDAVASHEGAYEEDRQQIWLGICHAHSGPGGEYHYHADGNCVHWQEEGSQTWEDYSVNSSRSISEHSPIVGFAFDGYPIYGFVGWDDNGEVKEMTSSYKLKEGENGYNGIDDYEYVSGLGDLDSCNGQFGVTPDYPNGTYHYHTTWENGDGDIGFPYFINCYRGEITTGNDSGNDGDDPCAGQGETWGPGIGPPPEDCDAGPPPTMEAESEPVAWYNDKIPPIGEMAIFMIIGVAFISRFRLKAFSEGVPSLVDTIDVYHQDPILA
jgi:hypothetical protein